MGEILLICLNIIKFNIKQRGSQPDSYHKQQIFRTRNKRGESTNIYLKLRVLESLRDWDLHDAPYCDDVYDSFTSLHKTLRFKIFIQKDDQDVHKTVFSPLNANYHK
ncbi:CLUMA_CG010213, isoform A [Clunio marinus]|uniref:CLUMA_CG010213, isoform A n=1 Tax=Clunio marinus TaxID=568069 RepID=A0A1J1IAG8_9DIPT|nr:CLUMA_CG010213, isoform A [Clunio marinus]